MFSIFLRTDSDLRVSTTLSALIMFPSLAFGQANVNVPSDDRAYHDLELLSSFGLVARPHATTRPLGSDYFRAVIEDLRLSGESIGRAPRAAREAISRLDRRFSDGDAAIRVEEFRLEWVGYGAEHRAIPGAIAADLQPFTEYAGGRTYEEGANLAGEARLRLRVSDRLGLYFHGRGFTVDPSGAAGTDADLEILRLYARARIGNFNLLVGRDELLWGSGIRGNLMLSDNATPVGSFDALPLIKLSNASPFRLPWVLRILGPTNFTTFISKLEGDRTDPGHPWLIGLRINFDPVQNLEIGLSHAYIMGGEDFPTNFGFIDGLAEYFFIRKTQNFFFNVQGTPVEGKNIANHQMGGDFSARLPSLRGSRAFIEIYFEDLFSGFGPLFRERIAISSGLDIPRLSEDGAWSGFFQYTHTASVFATGSVPFLAGWSRSGRLLGTDLGPDANEIAASVTARSGDNEGSILVAWQNRGLRQLISRTGPDENRVMIGVTLARRLPHDFRIVARFQFMHTSQFDNLPGDTRDDVFGSVVMTYRPR